jgi:hypothetical protein
MGTDSSFFFLYNAIGGTVTLTEKFSINAVISNVLATTDLDAAGKFTTDTIGAGVKFIAKVNDNAEFNIGVALDVSTWSATGSDDETVTTFSIPVGIVLSF